MRLDAPLPLGELEPALRLFRDTNLGVRYFLRKLARMLDVEKRRAAVVEARNAIAPPTIGLPRPTLVDEQRLEADVGEQAGRGRASRSTSSAGSCPGGCFG